MRFNLNSDFDFIPDPVDIPESAALFIRTVKNVTYSAGYSFLFKKAFPDKNEYHHYSLWTDISGRNNFKINEEVFFYESNINYPSEIKEFSNYDYFVGIRVNIESAYSLVIYNAPNFFLLPEESQQKVIDPENHDFFFKSGNLVSINFGSCDYEFPWNPTNIFSGAPNLRRIFLSKAFYNKIKSGIPSNVKVIFI